MDQTLPRDAEESAPSTSQSASLSPPSTSQPKRRRTATTQNECCRTCRLRKVKCTGNPGNAPCNNCSRLELACSFTTASGAKDSDKVLRTTPSHSHTEAGTLRKRAQRACSQCHAHKTKCSGDSPKCKRCEASGLPCEYTPTRRKFTNVRFNSPSRTEDPRPAALPNIQPEETSPSSSNGTVSATAANNSLFWTDTGFLQAEEFLLRKDIILTHVNEYFRNLYWVPCLGFLHPEITYQEIEENRFSTPAAAAICAISSAFVNPGPAGQEFGKRCSMQVESYIYRRIQTFANDSLLLYALNILYHLLQGSFAQVWQCFGVASRLMIGLQINWDVVPNNTSFIEQECLRRVAWQLFNLDRLLAGGYEEYISCRSENMRIPLPCNEDAFRNNQPIVAERLHEKPGKSPSTINLHAIQIRLVDLRHRIQVATKRLTHPYPGSGAGAEPSKLMTDINNLQNELTRLHASIPDDLRLGDHTIDRYSTQDSWVGYVVFHTHMAGVHMHLYSFALPGPKEPSCVDILRKLPREFLERSKKQAVAHAMCLARFFNAIRNTTKAMPDPNKWNLVGDFSVTHMASQCIRILLIALQYKLYKNLEDHTTAPLWRSAPATEEQIRGFIATMMEITEAWSHVLGVTKYAHQCIVDSVAEFDRTRKLSDRHNLSHTIVPIQKGEGYRLPGPHLILSHGGLSSSEEEQRGQANDTANQAWWPEAQTPQPMSAPTPGPISYPTATTAAADVEVEVDCAPPGLPLFLAQARGQPVSNDMPLDFDAVDNSMMHVPPDLGAMAHSNFQYMQVQAPNSGEMGLVRMDGVTPEHAMFQTHQHPGTEAQHFMTATQAMFVNGYTTHFPNGSADPTTYMQQNNFE